MCEVVVIQSGSFRPAFYLRLGFGNSRMKLRSKEHRLRLRRGRRCLRKRIHMTKISVIGAILLGAAVLCAAPMTVDKAQARYGPAGALLRGHAAVPAGTPCKTAAKLEFPMDKKARHAFKHECKAAWKAHKKAA